MVELRGNGKRMRQILVMTFIVLFILTVIFPWSTVWAHRQATGVDLPIVSTETEVVTIDGIVMRNHDAEFFDTATASDVVGDAHYLCSAPPTFRQTTSGILINNTNAIITNWKGTCVGSFRSETYYEVNVTDLVDEQITKMIFDFDTTSSETTNIHVRIQIIGWDDVDVDTFYSGTGGTEDIVKHTIFEDDVPVTQQTVKIEEGEFVLIQDAVQKSLEPTVIISLSLVDGGVNYGTDATMATEATDLIGSVETWQFSFIAVEQTGTGRLSSDLLGFVLIIMSVVVLMFAMLATKDIEFNDIM